MWNLYHKLALLVVLRTCAIAGLSIQTRENLISITVIGNFCSADGSGSYFAMDLSRMCY
jgi:hypothetical protein